MTINRRTSYAILLSLVAAAPLAGQERWPMDQWLRQPVNDRTFDTYLQFFAYDRKLPLELEVRGTESSEGVTWERLSFQSTRGERVTANYYRAAGGGARRPALILVPGGIAEGKDGPGTKRTAEFLARGGFDILAIDLPHFGERDDGLLTTFTEQEKHDELYNQPAVYLAFVTQLVKDVGRAVDLLVTERGADPGRIGYVGLSRGAQVGFIVVGAERRLRAALFLYAGHFDRGETEHLGAACPANYIGRIAPRSFLMVNGVYDDDYDRDRSVEPLYRLAKQPKRIIWAQTGHAAAPPEAMSEALRFLKEALPER